MMHIQSDRFPFHDRNPRSCAKHIFFARPGDHQAAQQDIWHAPGPASPFDMPITSPARPQPD